MYLAIDQGGHATRAAVFDADGGMLSYVVVPVATHITGKVRVEQDPDEIVQSVRAAIRLAVRKAGIRPPSIRSAGLAAQRSGVVCWDRRTGDALSPVLSWQDRRRGRAFDSLASRAGPIRDRTGLPLSPHYGAAKIRWCLDRLPAVRRALAEGTVACGPLASFLMFRILEEKPLAADPVSAGRTQLWSRRTMDWDPELLRWFGIDRLLLPESVPTRHEFGCLAIGAAPVPLQIATGDQNAMIHASGRSRTDTVYVNLGTGAFALRPFRADPGIPPGLLSYVARRDGRTVEHALEGTVNGAASALLWLERRHRIRHLWHNLPAWLESADEPPLVLNGVSGLGSPYWISDFRSRFIGTGGPDQRAVAVVESVVFLLCSILNSLGAPSPPVRRIRLSGGLSMLNGLCRRLADLSGLPLLRNPDHEATLRGTASLLAGHPLERAGKVRAANRFNPRRDSALADRYQRWREAMAEALRDPDR